MDEDRRTRLTAWLSSGQASLQPLTFPQRELWEASPVAPNEVSNHMFSLINVRGEISAEECEMAVQGVVERQEALRTSFLPGKERPVQLIRANGAANFQYRDLLSAERSPEALEELAAEIFYEPFDLLQGPLYRVRVVRRAADDLVMALAIHHSIADGWSLGVFIQDLCAVYLQGLLDKNEKMPPVELSYTEWGKRERAFWQPEELKKRVPFWKSRLEGSRRFWGDCDFRKIPERWVYLLPEDISKSTRELAKRGGATLFNTLLSTFQIALSQWTGSDDIVVGTPVANRSKLEVHETIGYCSGIVPLRTQIDSRQPFSDALREVNQGTIDCFANAMPFAELMHELGETRSSSRNPIFEVRFALQNYPIPEIDLPKFSVRLQTSSSGNPRYSLGCEITERGDALEIGWLYRQELFSLNDIQELSSLFQTVLTRACHTPLARISELVT